MRKPTIILIVVLLVMIAVIAGGYQFYVKDMFARFDRDEQFYEQLQSKLRSLESTFNTTEPQVVVDAWQGAVQPWAQAAAARTNYYEVEVEVEPVPENRTAPYHYRDEYRDIVQGLQQEVRQRGVMLVWQNFLDNVPSPDNVIGQAEVEDEMVEKWLRRLTYGRQTVNLLMDGNPAAILDLQVWPPYQEGVLEKWTTGVVLRTRMSDFVEFVNNLISDPNTYYEIDALKVSNANLRQPDPVLTVAMLLTRARYEPDAPAAAAPSDDRRPGGMMDPFMDDPFMFPGGDMGREGRGPAPTQQPQESWWQKLWPF
jgi:hypothetical protein